jgi:ABC-2 type transport system permease protein
MRLVVESGVLYRRALREIPRVPTRIAFPVIGPVMQLVLLTAVLTRVTQIPGYPARSSVQFMTAGVLALTVLAGAGGAGFQMVQDIDTGFFDKLRVAPISRAAIVLGLLLTDATRLAVQSLVVLVIALLLGAHIATGVPGLIGILVLAAIFGMAWSGISLNVALRTRNPEVTAAAGVLTFPLYFGSTAFMPYALLPHWLQVFNKVNPINYLILADRALMSRHWDWGAIGGALLASLIVGAITMPLATRAFQRAVSG